MKLNEWLDMEVGRAAKMAATFKRTASAVTQWRTNGVPVALMKDVRDFTKGEVTLDEMIPEPVEGMQLVDRRATDKAGA
jgi:hypothetical protein